MGTRLELQFDWEMVECFSQFLSGELAEVTEILQRALPGSRGELNIQVGFSQFLLSKHIILTEMDFWYL